MRFCEHEEVIRKLLKERGTCPDIDFAVRVFKHYLTLAYCGLSESETVANILVHH